MFISRKWLTSFLFFLSLFLRFSVIYANFETHNEYFYSQCKQFETEEEERSYSVSCREGILTYHTIDSTLLDSLQRPIERLEKERLTEQFYKRLKQFVLKKLEESVLKHSEERDCFVQAINSNLSSYPECREIVTQRRLQYKKALPLLRESLAVSSGLSIFGNIDKDIDHPHVDNQIQPLSHSEYERVNSQIKNLLDQKRTSLNERYKNLHPRTKQNRMQSSMRSYQKELEMAAQANYQNILSSAPFLAHITNGKAPESQILLDNQISHAFDDLKNHSMDEYFKWKETPPEDFEDFLLYPELINEFIHSWPRKPNQYQCDILEDLHQDYGPNGNYELFKNIGLAAATVVGGGVCFFTAGIGCALGVAIGSEAYVLSSSQSHLNQTIHLSRSGLIDHSHIQQARDSRNLDLMFTPLSFVGLKGTGAIRRTSLGLTRPVARPKSLFIERLIDYSPTSSLENKAWIHSARNTQTGGLFLDIENAALKRLNDSLGDKNLVTALTNQYKKILFDEMDQLQRKYPNLNILKYSDFKSTRFSFSGEIPTSFHDELENLYKRTNQKFDQLISQLPELNIPSKENPSRWFTAGIGTTADQAGISARSARDLTRESSRIIKIGDIRAGLQEKMKTIESTRQRVLAALESSPHLIDSQHSIPQVEIFEVLRKNKDKQADELISIFKNRFNHQLNPAELEDLRSYALQVDQFSPGIWLEDRVLANLDDAVSGGFSVDFKGMGAENMAQVARDLTNSSSVDDALKRIRSGEAKVTEEFNQSKSDFQNLVSETLNHFNIPITTKCSGDDCVSIPNTALPDLAKDKLLEALAKRPNPAKYRVSFVPPGVDQEVRSTLAAHGELIEKALRSQITGHNRNFIEPHIMDQISIGIEMPSQLATGRVRLHIKASQRIELTSSQRELIEKQLNQAIEQVNEDLSLETGLKTSYGH
ncbi:MAG: hypothetical protein CME60_06215 [Halobacteriovoraceae bacterium]|nr:hypothetical protein [Halobacteriovoraceae bacterium]